MVIKNVKVFTEEKTFEDGEIVIRDGLISEGKEDAGEVIDGEGCYAIPGLIDIHFHGCKGYDFCDGTKEAIHEIAKYEASIGVTAISPATMTLQVETLENILSTAAAYKKEAGDGADLIGVNMEGPFISKAKKGAQDATYIIPCSKDIFHRFQAAAQGLIKYIGVAPEEEGALEFVGQVKDEVNAYECGV